MSDEKKRDRALQRRVRERQEKTGESYQAALQQIIETPKSEPQQPAQRKVGRILLPFSTAVKVLPGQSAQITTRPQVLSFWPDRLLIKNADRWDIHRLTIGTSKSPWSSLIENGPTRRSASVFALDTWHPLVQREVGIGEHIAMAVTYTGPKEQGELFEASLFGWDGEPPTKPSDHKKPDTSERISESAESKPVRFNEMAILPIAIASPALFVDRFMIANAEDWIVHDIRTQGRSIFVSGGDLPGQMFTGSVPVILKPLAARDLVEIAATYVGKSATASLMVELSGTTKPTATKGAVSYFLPLSTDVPIVPAQSAQIRCPSGKAFLPERLVITDPDAWLINDIKVGNLCQTAQSGDFPGQCFSIRAVGCDVTFNSVPQGSDFEIITTRDADCTEDAAFYAGVQGHLIE